MWAAIASLACAALMALCVVLGGLGKEHGSAHRSKREEGARSAMLADLGRTRTALQAFSNTDSDSEEEEKPHDFLRARVCSIVTIVAMYSFAWCGMRVVVWTIDIQATKQDWTAMWAHVLAALTVSLICVCLMYLFDKIADRLSDVAHGEYGACANNFITSIRQLILSFGMMVGFSWEHAFSLGVEDMANRMRDQRNLSQFMTCMLRIFICSLVILIVLPAYRWYIVPTLYTRKHQHKLEKLQEAEEKAHEYNSDESEETSE